jgi:hypothetical protein
MVITNIKIYLQPNWNNTKIQTKERQLLQEWINGDTNLTLRQNGNWNCRVYGSYIYATLIW